MKDEFKVGQRVKQWDTDDPENHFWAYGTIDNIGDLAIEIAWDDITETCLHYKEDWDSIIIIKDK